MFGNLTCMFSFETCLQSGGKKGVQLLNTLFTMCFSSGLSQNLVKVVFIARAYLLFCTNLLFIFFLNPQGFVDKY